MNSKIIINLKLGKFGINLNTCIFDILHTSISYIKMPLSYIYAKLQIMNSYDHLELPLTYSANQGNNSGNIERLHL